MSETICKPEFDQDEANWLINAIDAAIKEQGLRGATLGLRCAGKMQKSLPQSGPMAKPEVVKHDASEGEKAESSSAQG